MPKKPVKWPPILWLEAFVAVIDNGGVEARATQAVGRSASSINRYVGDLEDWIRTPLFTRDLPRQLTDYGKQFEGVARSVIQDLKSARMPLKPEPLNPHPVKRSVAGLKIKKPN